MRTFRSKAGVFLALLCAQVACQSNCEKSQTSPVIGSTANSIKSWEIVSPGIDYRLFENDQNDVPLLLHALRADAHLAAFYGLDYRDSTKRVTEAAKENSGVFFINGNFFDTDKQPLGLLISDNKVLNPLRKADWGVFSVDNNRVSILHTKDFRLDEDNPPEFAIQCGPRVVIDGKVPKLKPAGARRRSGLCVLDGGQAIVFALEGFATTKRIGDFLAAAPKTGGLGCIDAMLLDGGPSTQGYMEAPAVNIVGLYPVPTIIYVAPR